MNEEYTVNSPYGSCNCHYNHISVPDSNAGGLHKLSHFRGSIALPKDDVHAKQNQQRGGGEGKIGRDLEKMKAGVLRVLFGYGAHQKGYQPFQQ